LNLRYSTQAISLPFLKFYLFIYFYNVSDDSD
jgi:hypothetical protein